MFFIHQTEKDIINNMKNLIKDVNNTPINLTTLKYEFFEKLNRIFSFFYAKKIMIKKQHNYFLKKELTKIFNTLDFKKVEKIFFELENLELFNNVNYTNINGDNLLRRTKAKYYHCKRFFK